MRYADKEIPGPTESWMRVQTDFLDCGRILKLMRRWQYLSVKRERIRKRYSRNERDAALQLPHLCSFVQALIAGRRGVSRNCISHSRSDKSRNDESMTAGRFR